MHQVDGLGLDEGCGLTNTGIKRGLLIAAKEQGEQLMIDV